MSEAQRDSSNTEQPLESEEERRVRRLNGLQELLIPTIETYPHRNGTVRLEIPLDIDPAGLCAALDINGFAHTDVSVRSKWSRRIREMVVTL